LIGRSASLLFPRAVFDAAHKYSALIQCRICA
jgi:hypothetical protein